MLKESEDKPSTGPISGGGDNINAQGGDIDKVVKSFVGNDPTVKKKKIPFSVYKPTSDTVLLRKSQYKIRPDVVFF